MPKFRAWLGFLFLAVLCAAVWYVGQDQETAYPPQLPQPDGLTSKLVEEKSSPVRVPISNVIAPSNSRPSWGIAYGMEFWRPKRTSEGRPFDAEEIADRMNHRLTPEGAASGLESVHYSARISEGVLEFMPKGSPQAKLRAWTGEIARKSATIYRRGGPTEEAQVTGNTWQNRLSSQASEHLDFRRSGVEATWIFNEQPAGEGDLTVDWRVSGMPYKGETERGFEFADSQGRAAVAVGKAVAVDASGARWDLSSRWIGDRIQITAPAALLALARYPLAIDPTILPLIEMPHREPGHSMVPGTISAAQSKSVSPLWLMAWQDKRLDMPSQIRATVMNDDLSVYNPNGVALNAGTAAAVRPRVSSLEGAWIVVWEEVSSGEATTLKCAVIPSSSSTIPSIQARTIDATPRIRKGLKVVPGFSEWLIVYEDVTGESANYAFVNRSGTVLPGAVKLYTGEGDQFSPSAAFDGTKWAVAWESRLGDVSTIVARNITITGYNASLAPFVVANYVARGTIPSICRLDPHWLVILQEPQSSGYHRLLHAGISKTCDAVTVSPRPSDGPFASGFRFVQVASARQVVFGLTQSGSLTSWDFRIATGITVAARMLWDGAVTEISEAAADSQGAYIFFRRADQPYRAARLTTTSLDLMPPIPGPIAQHGGAFFGGLTGPIWASFDGQQGAETLSLLRFQTSSLGAHYIRRTYPHAGRIVVAEGDGDWLVAMPDITSVSGGLDLRFCRIREEEDSLHIDEVFKEEGEGDQFAPSLARGTRGWAAVWSSTSVANSSSAITDGVFIDMESYSKSVLGIFSSPPTCASPQIAWNGSAWYLVDTYRPSLSTPVQTIRLHKILEPEIGDAPVDLLPLNFTNSTLSRFDAQLSVAGENTLLVWRTSDQKLVYGWTLLDPTGGIGTYQDLPTAPLEPSELNIAASDSSWLLSWTAPSSSYSFYREIQGVTIDPAAGLFASPSFEVADDTMVPFGPQAARSADGWLIAFEGYSRFERYDPFLFALWVTDGAPFLSAGNYHLYTPFGESPRHLRRLFADEHGSTFVTESGEGDFTGTSVTRFLLPDVAPFQPWTPLGDYLVPEDTHLATVGSAASQLSLFSRNDVTGNRIFAGWTTFELPDIAGPQTLRFGDIVEFEVTGPFDHTWLENVRGAGMRWGGNQVRLIGVGELVLGAWGSQNGGESHYFEKTFTVEKALDEVYFDELVATYTGEPIEFNVRSRSGEEVEVFFEGELARIIEPGSYEVTARVASEFYEGEATATIEVHKAANEITFDTVPTLYKNSTPHELVARSSGDAVVLFEIASGPATLKGNVLSPAGLGEVVVRAYTEETEHYKSASVTQTIQIVARSQQITFEPIGSRAFQNTPIPLVATSDSGLPIVFLVLSGSGAVDGSELTLTGIGTVTVRAEQSGSAVYAGAFVDQTFEVGKMSQVLNLQVPEKVEFQRNGIPIQAASSAGLPVRLDLVGTAASLGASQLFPTGLGVVLITASQAGNETVAQAAEIQKRVEIVDTTRPVVSADRQVWRRNRQNEVVLRGKAFDLHVPRRVHYRVRKGTGKFSAWRKIAVSGEGLQRWAIPLSISGRSPSTVQLQAEDRAGNKSEVVRVTIQ